jgi:hypothetical protein
MSYHIHMSCASDDGGHSDDMSELSIDDDIHPDPTNITMTEEQYLTCHTATISSPDHHMIDNPPDIPSTIRQSKCWLCTFSPHPTAVQMHNFIIQNISTMDVKYIVSQVKDEIKTHFPRAMGIHKRDITAHITEHMISPHVKIASTIRSLVTVADTLKGGLTRRDPETNDILVDIKNTELFLKVVSQMMTAYKMDCTKLLFAKTTPPL